MTLREMLHNHGRKFTTTVLAIMSGTAVAVVGIIAAAAYPAAAPSIATIVGSFGVILSVAVGSMNAANAAGDFAHKTPAGMKPAPRLSGAIVAPVDREDA